MYPQRKRRPHTVGIALFACLCPAIAASQAAPATVRNHVVTRASVESLARGSRTGTVIRVSGSMVDTVAHGASEVPLKAGEILASAASAGRPTIDRVPPVPHVDLPEVILAPATGGGVVRLGVAIETNGLFYSTQEDAYIGTVRIGLVDDAHPSETRALDSKVRVLIGADGEISPDALELDHTNLPFQSVTVRARTVQADSVIVRIRPAFQPDGYTFHVAVRRPHIIVGVSPAGIDGFGLQRAMVSVTLSAEAGLGRTVIVSGTRNAPIDGTLTLSAGETRFTRIASRGVGIDTIRVSSPQLAGALVEVRYLFPTGFLIALTIGAVIGAIARGIQRRGLRRTLAAGDLLAALSLGVLVAVGYAIGVNLVGIPLPAFGGEAVTLVGAALGALLGETATKRLTQRTAAAVVG